MRSSPFPDLLQLEELLTSEQKAILKTVRDFVIKEAEPKIRQAWRTESFPESLISSLGALGIFGATLTGYGLPGMDPISYGLVMRELERCDSGLRSFASVQGGLVMHAIHEFGTEEQKTEWLPKLASGNAVGCFGLTESEGGSDPGAMRTSAVDKGDHWELTGSKMWITNGNLSHISVVWAKTSEGIRGFLVPLGLEGFKVIKMQGKLSLRASVTSELIFDRVKLPKSALLEKTGGLRSALSCLNQARYGIAWGALGAAEACFDEALAYAKERVLFKKKLAAFQLVQQKLATMAIEIAKCQLLTFRIGQLKEKGSLHHSQISIAKQTNVKMALDVARTSRDILGANGIMDEYKSMRHLCNLETVYT
jgi:glutaryl-CoA dehydrogenase